MGGEKESGPQKSDKKGVWILGGLLTLLEECNKMTSLSHSRVRGSKTREINGFSGCKAGPASVFSTAPLDEKMGVGSEKMGGESGPATFFPPPVLGIPENSFQLDPKWALSGF